MVYLINIWIFSFGLFHPKMDHDIHLSVCEIALKKSKLELTIKTFLDDLQLAVGLTPGEDLPPNYTNAEDLIALYISKRFQIDVAGKPIKFQLTDISAGPESVWLSLVSNEDFNEFPTDIKLRNDFLIEIFNDQTNLVKFKMGSSKKEFILNRTKTVINLNTND